jgi:hypothetical protein
LRQDFKDQQCDPGENRDGFYSGLSASEQTALRQPTFASAKDGHLSFMATDGRKQVLRFAQDDKKEGEQKVEQAHFKTETYYTLTFPVSVQYRSHQAEAARKLSGHLKGK